MRMEVAFLRCCVQLPLGTPMSAYMACQRYARLAKDPILRAAFRRSDMARFFTLTWHKVQCGPGCKGCCLRLEGNSLITRTINFVVEPGPSDGQLSQLSSFISSLYEPVVDGIILRPVLLLKQMVVRSCVESMVLVCSTWPGSSVGESSDWVLVRKSRVGVHAVTFCMDCSEGCPSVVVSKRQSTCIPEMSGIPIYLLIRLYHYEDYESMTLLECPHDSPRRELCLLTN